MSDHSSLPARPSLEQLRKQAKDLTRDYRAGDSAALARLRAHKSKISETTGEHPGTLADAQHCLAREYGFESWPKLKRHVLLTQRPGDFHVPTWGPTTWEFFTAVYEGEKGRVRQMLRDEPWLARAEYAYLQPLHYAVKGGRIDMVRLLLEAGANPLAEGWSGRPLGDDTPLARARDREQPEIVRLLEDAAANALTDLPARPEAPPDSLDEIERAMSKCGHKGDIKGALALLEQHPTLAYAGLYEAVHQGHTKLARLLLERGADPTKPWRWSCWLTPLMHSLRHDRPNYEMASMLMDHGVTANDANGMGMTILHILVGLGTPAPAAWILDRGADINRRDNEFESTPLAWAARVGRAEMIELLLSRGALPCLPDDEPWSMPAAWARRHGHPHILKLLEG
jgi:ankyrin repeat protein